MNLLQKFDTSLSIDDVGYVSLAEIILQIQNRLSQQYSMSLVPTVIAADAPAAAVAAYEEKAAKNAKVILKTIYKSLSDVSTNIFTTHQQSIGAAGVMTWQKARQALLTCFATKIDVQEIRFQMDNCVQSATESPRAYFNRLLSAIRCLRIGLDVANGDGLDGSAGIAGTVTPVSEPYYFLANYNDNDYLKTRFFRGLTQNIRTEWNHVHSSHKSQSVLVQGNLTHMVEWAERYWTNSTKDSLKKITAAPKKILHAMLDNDQTDANDSDQLFQLSKKSKIENPLQQMLDSNRQLMESQRQNNDALVSSLLASFRTNTGNQMENKDSGFRSSRPPPPNRNRFNGKSITTLVKPKVCWTCKGDHFAQHCPSISRLEQLILLLNRVYRMNRGKNDPPTTIEKLCLSENVAPPTLEETTRLDNIYRPLKESVTKRSMGSNARGYCHFCHATGLWTRECKSFCPYCKINGHGWETCSNPTYVAHVRTRLQSFPPSDPLVVNALFSLIEMDEVGDAFVMDDVY